MYNPNYKYDDFLDNNYDKNKDFIFCNEATLDGLYSNNIKLKYKMYRLKMKKVTAVWQNINQYKYMIKKRMNYILKLSTSWISNYINLDLNKFNFSKNLFNKVNLYMYNWTLYNNYFVNTSTVDLAEADSLLSIILKVHNKVFVESIKQVYKAVRYSVMDEMILSIFNNRLTRNTLSRTLPGLTRFLEISYLTKNYFWDYRDSELLTFFYATYHSELSTLLSFVEALDKATKLLQFREQLIL